MEYIKEENRIYSKDENGKIIAEIDFEKSNDAMIITHTFVDESLRGQGIASKLVEMAIEEIKKRGLKPGATCSYAKSWLEKHKEEKKMDFLELAKERYSCRKFKDERITKEELDKILEAGRVAPTARNYQPQRTLVIEKEDDLAKFDECSPCRFGAKTVLLVFYDITESWKRAANGEECGLVDGSIILTHYMLEASSIGIGSTWVGHVDPARVKELFDIPENYYFVSALPLGYPADDVEVNPRHFERKELKETVSFDRF